MPTGVSQSRLRAVSPRWPAAVMRAVARATKDAVMAE